MKPFVKLQCATLDRFGTREEFLLAVSLLCLMDYKGRIPMDQVTLAARLRWDLDKELIPVLGRLMQPDPNSKCKKNGGAFVAYFDSKHTELGYIIPAAPTYRRRNADTQRRRDYKAQKMREYRAKGRGQRVDKRGQRVDKRGQNPPSTVDTSGQSVDTRGQNVDCDKELRERNKNSLSLPSLISEPNGSAHACATDSFTDWDPERIGAFFAQYGPGRLPAVEELPERVKKEIVTVIFRLRQKNNGGAE